ncbi:sialyltransferase [Chloropicon primus]|nr:sialyltransferase [Chloropicon primus]
MKLLLLLLLVVVVASCREEEEGGCSVLYAGTTECNGVNHKLLDALEGEDRDPFSVFEGSAFGFLRSELSSYAGVGEGEVVKDPEGEGSIGGEDAGSLDLAFEKFSLGNLSPSKFINLRRVLPRDVESLPGLLRGPQGSRKSGKTCAVVGNSGVLTRNELGSEIDEHDVVIRFNLSPTLGYENHVGKRTSIRFWSRSPTGRKISRPSEDDDGSDVHFVADAKGLGSLLRAFSKKSGKGRHRDADEEDGGGPGYTAAEDVPIVSPKFLDGVSNSIGFVPSVGFFGIAFAMHLCSKVDAYGFFAQEPQGVRFRYFDSELTPPVTSQQLREQALAFRLHDAGIIRVKEPCSRECADQGLLRCGQCLGLDMAELLEYRRFTAEQESANRKRDRELHEDKDSDERNAKHHRGAKKGEAKKDEKLGWEYLIESNRIEEVGIEGLKHYLIDNDLDASGDTWLELRLQVLRHVEEKSRPKRHHPAAAKRAK